MQVAQERIEDTIHKNIQALRIVVDSCSTESVVGYCMVKHLEGYFSNYDLSSPAKQILFLLGILLNSEEPSNPQEFSNHQWKRIVKPLESIFSAYMELYFASEEPLVNQSDQWSQVRQVSMVAFLNHFHQTLLASTEQVSDRIHTYLAPFDDQLSKDFGISASDALGIATWIGNKLQDSLDGLDKGVPESIFKVGKITYSELIGQYGTKGEKFWNLFTTSRGEGNQLKYPTDRSVAEERPLIRLSADVAMAFNINVLFTSILIRGEECLSTRDVRKEYFRNRDKVVEDHAKSIFAKIFGKDTKIYQNVFESPDKQNEHDIIIISKNICLLIEVKASPLVEPFRDPEKAFTRLRRFFRSDRSIQKAYRQALRLLKLIQSRKTTILYDQKGKEVLRLPSSIADMTYCVCVTRDNYGPLATFLPFLLDKHENEPYPWAVNILDLENLAEAWNYFGWDERQLGSYLSQRIKLHASVFSGDELDYAGAFIRHCGLHNMIQDDDTLIQLAQNYSDIFDDIHAHLNYGEHPVEINPIYPMNADVVELVSTGRTALVRGVPEGPIIVGRNNKCPCGSSVKFKRCHGR